ncbi:MAG: TldD/PmbA family protein [Candidatus Aenigmarchaeota archaeon]|nr:TldD/PmbA family protein [Candidatus Aenigmarchaeota archaeon]
MKELVHLALNVVRSLGADYGDIRIVREKSENIVVKNNIVEVLEQGESFGFGVRVLKKGAWGFASSNNLEKENIKRVAYQSVQIAEASSRIKEKDVILARASRIINSYKTPYKENPFKISLEKKIDYLISVDEEIRKIKGVNLSEVSFGALLKNTLFGNTEGSLIDQEIVHCGGSFEATAIRGNEIQTRSFPNSHGGQYQAGGFEIFEDLDLKNHTQETAEQAVALLSAPQCPSKKTNLILDGNQLALQIHESCGHPIELDRVLGMEASYAGTSFLTLNKLKKLKYGSNIVNITADATIPGGLGTFGYDDEGVKAQKFPIIQNGLFVNYLTSRETAQVLAQKSNGTMRADGWNRIPLIRMTNINLEPGDVSLEELIADTKDGIFMSTNHEWSIDDRRLNFQFGCEIAWEITNGKIKRILKNPNYWGMTPKFWNSCNAICNKNHWILWGLTNCGKGEPIQVMNVGHGTSPARFRGVKVGVGKW